MANGQLLPIGKQQFLDANGNPYAGGLVYFYIPSTTTPKNTYSDSGLTVPNTNPVVLDSAGRASIYGSGDYRQILKDADGATIWDQVVSGVVASAASTSLLYWGGTSGGTANAKTLTVSGFSLSGGAAIGFICGLANSGGAMTLQVNGGSVVGVKIRTRTGVRDPIVGDFLLNALYMVMYDTLNGYFVVVSDFPIQQTVTAVATNTTIASTVAENTLYAVDSTSGNVTMTLPNAATVGSGYALTFKKTVAANSVIVQRAGGALIDGQTSWTLAAQYDCIKIVSDGTNWIVVEYTIGNVNYQSFSTAGAATWTKPTGNLFGSNSLVTIEGWGGGGSGSRDTAVGTNEAGGGGGAYVREIMKLSALGATESVSVGAGGAALTGNGAGIAGGNTTLGTKFTAYGGGGGTAGGNGGGGGGWRGAGSGGTPGTGTGATNDVMFGGGSGTSGVGAVSRYGGGSGAGGGATNQNGGNSIYGGGGGGSRGGTGLGGTSVFGGAGGTGANASDGAQPGGGGGCGGVGGTGNSGKGGDGLLRVWVNGVA